MDIFKQVKLSWKGVEYIIPPNRVMGAIAVVENTVTLQELMEYQKRGTAPIAKLCVAIADVLQYAGCPIVSSDEVYASVMRNGHANSHAITALLMMMIPPTEVTERVGNVEGNGGKRKSSSRKRTKSQSGTDGLDLQNSGISTH